MTNPPRRGFEQPRPQGANQPPTPPWSLEGYLRGGYFDPKGNIKSELISQMADRVARALGEAEVTSNQLKRFFSQIRAIERQMERTPFDQVRPDILRLKAMVANYVGKGRNPRERDNREVFKRFIDQNVDLVTIGDEEGCRRGFTRGLVPHFECVVAFYKYRFPTK